MINRIQKAYACSSGKKVHFFVLSSSYVNTGLLPLHPSVVFMCSAVTVAAVLCCLQMSESPTHVSLDASLLLLVQHPPGLAGTSLLVEVLAGKQVQSTPAALSLRVAIENIQLYLLVHELSPALPAFNYLKACCTI